MDAVPKQKLVGIATGIRTRETSASDIGEAKLSWICDRFSVKRIGI